MKILEVKMSKNNLSDLEEIFNDENLKNYIFKALSEQAPVMEFSKENIGVDVPQNGYWVQCYSDSENFYKLWFELTTYIFSYYEHITIEVYEWDSNTLSKIKNIGWEYEIKNEYEVYSFSGILSEKVKNLVANNALNSNMELMWFCIKLMNKDRDETLTILPAHSFRENITVTIHQVSEEQIVFLKALAGKKLYISKDKKKSQ
jgi:hypothetical protein